MTWSIVCWDDVGLICAFSLDCSADISPGPISEPHHSKCHHQWYGHPDSSQLLPYTPQNAYLHNLKLIANVSFIYSIYHL